MCAMLLQPELGMKAHTGGKNVIARLQGEAQVRASPNAALVTLGD